MYILKVYLIHTMKNVKTLLETKQTKKKNPFFFCKLQLSQFYWGIPEKKNKQEGEGG